MYINDPMCLNSKRAWTGLTNEQYHKLYREANYEHLTEHHKKYYEDNKDQILAKMKIYREQNSEKISERRKELIKENHEHILQLARANRSKWAEKIYENRKEKMQCPCGSIFRYDDKTRHERTKKHQAWLKDHTQDAETI